MSHTDAGRWQRLYTHLLDIEHHWTEQVQNQQQRISTILTMNGYCIGEFSCIANSYSS